MMLIIVNSRKLQSGFDNATRAVVEEGSSSNFIGEEEIVFPFANGHGVANVGSLYKVDGAEDGSQRVRGLLFRLEGIGGPNDSPLSLYYVLCYAFSICYQVHSQKAHRVYEKDLSL